MEHSSRFFSIRLVPLERRERPHLKLISKGMRFLEIYAGTAKLTHTVAEKGCEVADPIDLRFGTDALAH